jgi:hypothetical protein
MDHLEDIFDYEVPYDDESILAMVMANRSRYKILVPKGQTIEEALKTHISSRYNHTAHVWTGPPQLVKVFVDPEQCDDKLPEDAPEKVQILDKELDWLQWTAELVEITSDKDGGKFVVTYWIVRTEDAP